MNRIYSFACAFVLSVSWVSSSSADFTITLNGLGGMTTSQQAAFNDAKNTWESIIVGYKPGVTLTGVTINASIAPDDGPGGTLGSAGPDFVTNQAGTWYTTEGSMEFDSADVPTLEANGTFDDVILHEMAHVLGFGTLWTSDWNDLLDTDGNYVGANALAAWQNEFSGQGSATAVPVEQDGGPGTAGGHWNENLNGSGATGIVDGQGRDMRDELMTGWLNSNLFISNTTRQQFVDLGYEVSQIPEPGTIFGIATISTLLILRRRRRM